MAWDKTSVIHLQIDTSIPIISSVEVSANGKSVIIDNVLVDTGSAGTIFSADIMLDIGMKPKIDDGLIVISGVGGTEYAFSKTVAAIKVGHLMVCDFKVQVGAMNYGFKLDGIIGMDFLMATKAKLDCEQLTLS
jgi:predicted aspartyl protease